MITPCSQQDQAQRGGRLLPVEHMQQEPGPTMGCIMYVLDYGQLYQNDRYLTGFIFILSPYDGLSFINTALPFFILHVDGLSFQNGYFSSLSQGAAFSAP